MFCEDKNIIAFGAVMKEASDGFYGKKRCSQNLVFQVSIEVQEDSYVLMQMSCGRNPRRSIEKCLEGFQKEDQYLPKDQAQRRFGEVICSRKKCYCKG